MSKPRLLDLYSCAGGMAVGYARAGFEVVGADITKQPRYPFEFHQADALQFLQEHGHEFDAIHGSPPCQRYSAGTRASDRSKHPDLVAATRAAMIATGKPYVIENVAGAPLLNPVLLCGRMFNLTATDEDGTKLHLDRHRKFETNWGLVGPPDCRPHDRSLQVAGSYGGARRDKSEARNIRHGGYVPSLRVQQELLGIDWMKEGEMYQAIPPAYAEYVGKQLLEHLA